jgi:uncharacterized protein DUF4350
LKKDRKYIAAFIFAFALLVFVEYIAPRPINWNPTFSKKDKIPYGDFALYDFLSDIFPNQKVTTIEKPIYNTLSDTVQKGTNYIIINETFGLDTLNLKYLMQYVKNGNNVFIAAENFNGAFADSLKLSTWVGLSLNPITKDSTSLNFSDESIHSNESFRYKKGSVDYYFASYDTARTTVLGTNSEKKDNYIQVKYGDGAFYLSTVPLAFTNYNALKGKNSEYIFRALSYLPVANTKWDEYYKVTREQGGSPLRFILSNGALKAAYYLMLFGLILYVIFEGKRKQRVIPIIKPLQNTNLEFVETIGRLYYQKGSNTGMARKKIVFFLDHIRSEYNIQTSAFNEDFYNSLSAKTEIAKEELKNLFTFIQRVQVLSNVDEQTLLSLNNQIETFYRKNK